jgi:hypothetical protein
MRPESVFAAAAVLLVLSSGCKKKEEPKPGPEAKPAAAETVFGPVVAGAFYQSDPAALKAEIEKYLAEAKTPELKGRLIAVISPHAGYQYSGPVMAYAYKAIAGQGRKKFVILAPSHRVGAVGGIAVLDADYYQTPLGKVKINRGKVKELLGQGNWVVADTRFFAQEHSAEVQLPFLQVAVGNDLEVVMIVMPDQGMAQTTAAALKAVFPEPDWVFIASSDMSHYHPDKEAKNIDQGTLKLIEKLDIDGLAHTTEALCGIAPVLTVMYLVKPMEESKAVLLNYQNSFDTTGQNPERVVGYGAAALLVKETSVPQAEAGEAEELQPYGGPLTLEEKKELLKIARESVESYVRKNTVPNFDTRFERLKEKGAAFVTINKNGQLRGCIGHILAMEPLYLCVRDVACQAARHDPRFPPVTAEELSSLEYEISVLSPMVLVKDLKKIEVGKDGLLMRRGMYQGLLLPQVPVEYGWTREQFLSQTCQKAGMSEKCWTWPDTEVFHFRGIVFSEKELK